MLQWAFRHLFVWVVRLAVLVVAVLTLANVIHSQLGYRMALGPMFLGALLVIVLVRVWMPWSVDDDKR